MIHEWGRAMRERMHRRVCDTTWYEAKDGREAPMSPEGTWIE